MKFLKSNEVFSYQLIQKSDRWIFKIESNAKLLDLPLFLNDEVNKLLNKSHYSAQILLVDELLKEGFVKYDNNEYYFPMDDYEALGEQEVEILDLPKYFYRKIFLKSDLSVGVDGFSVKPLLQTLEGEFTKSYKRIGRYLELRDESFILTQEQNRLFNSCDNLANATKGMEQFQAIAEIKTAAHKAKAKCDEYLSNENIMFAEDLGIDIEQDKPNQIKLKPTFNSLDESQNGIIQNSPEKKYHEVSNAGKKTRLFVKNDVHEQIKILKENDTITDSDIPKFIKNPMAFLDERIVFDLDSFSARVKGLKVITYTAQPYFHLQESEKLDWFDYGFGIKLKPDDELSDEKNLDLDTFGHLLDIAKENDGYVKHEDEWIYMDTEQGEQFLESIKEIDKISEDHQLNMKGLRQILEIFENIEDLEYNETFFKELDNIRDYGLDKYVNPQGFKATLYNYQKEGHQWLKSLDLISAGGLLADDMGLGKTVQLISYMQHLHNMNDLKPSLIVLPAALIDNWVDEIYKFSTGIDVGIYHGNYGPLPKSFDNSDVYLTTYETLVNKQLIFGKVNWKLIICDEAQKIKNSSTYAASAVKAMKTKRRMALTGTPVENGLKELWSILDYVQPGLLGSYKQFRNEFELPIQKDSDSQQVDNLLRTIKPVYIRRTKADKLDGLPMIYETKTKCKMSQEQQQLYIEQINLGKADPKQRMPALTRMLTLTSHPRALTGDLSGSVKELLRESPKLQLTVEILNSIKKKNEKVIIFTRLRNMQSILRRVLVDQFGIDPMIINGETKMNRSQIIKSFSDVNGFNIILLSPKAAGIGLNITSANHVIHYTRDWNPAVEKQATDRTYRIGQTKDVQVYYPIATSSLGETVEEKLDRLLERKKALIEKVVVTKDQFKMLDDEMLEFVFE